MASAMSGSRPVPVKLVDLREERVGLLQEQEELQRLVQQARDLIQRSEAQASLDDDEAKQLQAGRCARTCRDPSGHSGAKGGPKCCEASFPRVPFLMAQKGGRGPSGAHAAERSGMSQGGGCWLVGGWVGQARWLASTVMAASVEPPPLGVQVPFYAGPLVGSLSVAHCQVS